MLKKIYPCRLSVRWTAKEKKEVERKAKKAGKSVSRYLVESALNQ